MKAQNNTFVPRPSHGVPTESIVKPFPSVPDRVIDNVIRRFADRASKTRLAGPPADLSRARKIAYPYPEGFNNHSVRHLYFVQTGPARGKVYLNIYSGWNPNHVVDQWSDLGTVAIPMAMPRFG